MNIKWAKFTKAVTRQINWRGSERKVNTCEQRFAVHLPQRGEYDDLTCTGNVANVAYNKHQSRKRSCVDNVNIT